MLHSLFACRRGLGQTLDLDDEGIGRDILTNKELHKLLLQASSKLMSHAERTSERPLLA